MQATLPLTEYLNNHNIPWFPINISFGPERTEKYPMGKKHLEPYQETNYKPSTNDFQNLTQEDIHRRQAYPYKHIAMDTSKVGHVDVDEAWADDEEARQEYPHYLSASKNMPHFFTFYDRAEENRNTESTIQTTLVLKSRRYWMALNQTAPMMPGSKSVWRSKSLGSSLRTGTTGLGARTTITTGKCRPNGTPLSTPQRKESRPWVRSVLEQ